MKEKFEDVLKRELKNEFEKQMNLQIDEKELSKVMKQYRRVVKSPLYEVKQMDKKTNNQNN